MDKQVVALVYEKATKNKYRYLEEGNEPPVLHTLYIEKYAVGNPPPTRLTVTIEAKE